MSADLINACFEFFGGFFLWKNVYTLFKDKMVRGIHWVPTTFFFTWGLWNLYYYPHLDQWWSFAGGINIMIPNAVWIYLMYKYRKN